MKLVSLTPKQHGLMRHLCEQHIFSMAANKDSNSIREGQALLRAIDNAYTDLTKDKEMTHEPA